MATPGYAENKMSNWDVEKIRKDIPVLSLEGTNCVMSNYYGNS